MRFSPEWIQKLKETVSLIDIVSENVELKKSGNQRFMGRCPFHGDRSPSFSVNKDFYYCFGCKKTGDVIRFMMELHGLGFEESCEELAEKAQLALPQSNQTAGEERALLEKRLRLQQMARLNYFAALKFYHHNLLQGSGAIFEQARTYLSSRGISEASIAEFQIGVAPSQYEGLVQFLKNAKAPLDLARQAGLIRPSQKQAGDYDFFRDRLLFPLIDVRGRVVGFGGRMLGAEDGPKYLNTAESDLFSKSRFLYGLYQAKKFIRESETVIIVEGYFDVVGLHQAGFKNAVATCGTSLTEEHLKTLARIAKKMILFFDQDAAGIGATVKSMEIGLKMGMILYSIPFQSKLDPDEFLLKNPDVDSNPIAQLTEMIGKAYPILDFQIDQEMKASEGSIEARALALKKVTQWLSAFTDGVGRSLRIDDLIRRWKVPPNALGLLAPQVATPAIGVSRRPAGPVPRVTQSKTLKRPPIRPRDRELIQYLVRFERFGGRFLEAKKQLPENLSLSALFQDSEIQEFIDHLQSDPAGYSRLRQAPETMLSDRFSQELRSVIIEGLLREAFADEDEQLDSVLLSSIHHVWAQISQEVRVKMLDAERAQDTKSFEEYSKQFLDLQKKLKEFENSYVSRKSP